MNSWVYDDMYQHNGVYYFIWRVDCADGPIYNLTLERNNPPVLLSGYASIEALLKTKFGI